MTDTEEKLTFGEKAADKVAEVGGSWKFVIGFTLFILIWIIINSIILFNRGFDPYPYILLNLFLSMLASIQAPIIMMSNNRQDKKKTLTINRDVSLDEITNDNVLKIHEKMDYIIDKINKI